MKRFLILSLVIALGVVLLPAAVAAQTAQTSQTTQTTGETIKGSVKSASGKNIEFVTLMVEGTTTGFITDEQGNFSIPLSDSLDGHDLIFSHISFNETKINIGELKRRYAASVRPIVVKLDERAEAIPQVVVQEKRAKLHTFVRPGMSMGEGLGFWLVPHEAENDPDYFGKNKIWRQDGPAFETDEPVKLQTLDFSISACTMDSAVVMRIIVYKMEPDSTLTSIMRKPVYVRLKKSAKEEFYACDLSPYGVEYASGTICLGIAFIGGSHGGNLIFPAYMGGTPYYIIRNNKLYERIDIASLGIRAQGYKATKK